MIPQLALLECPCHVLYGLHKCCTNYYWLLPTWNLSTLVDLHIVESFVKPPRHVIYGAATEGTSVKWCFFYAGGKPVRNLLGKLWYRIGILLKSFDLDIQLLETFFSCLPAILGLPQSHDVTGFLGIPPDDRITALDSFCVHIILLVVAEVFNNGEHVQAVCLVVSEEFVEVPMSCKLILLLALSGASLDGAVVFH